MALPAITLHDVLSAVRSLGPPPVGNPHAIREYAASLRRAAGNLDGSQRLLSGQAVIPNFSGPAADRHAGSVRGDVSAINDSRNHLEATAARLEAAAAHLESGQRAWSRSFAGRTAALPPGLVHSALAALHWKLP